MLRKRAIFGLFGGHGLIVMLGFLERVIYFTLCYEYDFFSCFFMCLFMGASVSSMSMLNSKSIWFPSKLCLACLVHQVTFVVTHLNDQRISSAELRDLLIQSISVLVQYRDFLVAFESNEAATLNMPRALLSAFDNRSWIPVTNILLRLCKGSGFGSSKHGESSTSSVAFQVN